MSDPSTEGPRKDTAKDGIDDAETVLEATAESASPEHQDPAPEEPTAAAHEDPIETDHAHDEEHQGSSFASTALKVVLILLVGFGLAVWALPWLAPKLPQGVASALMPSQIETDQRLAALEAMAGNDASAEAVAALEAHIADLQSRIAAAEQEAAEARGAAEVAAQAAQTASVSEDVVASAGSAAERAAGAAEAATTAATEAGSVASAAARDADTLARRMTGFEAQVDALSQELNAFGQSLAATTTEDGQGTSQEAAAAYGALKTRIDELFAQLAAGNFLTAEDASGFATVDDLRSARTALTANLEAALALVPPGGEIVTASDLGSATAALDEQVTGLSDRLGAVEARANEAEAAAVEARNQVGTAIKGAELDAAIAGMMSRLENGQSFAAPLDKIAALSGTAPPEPLAAVAATGTTTPEELLGDFGRAYQEAVAADIREQSDGGLFGNATARLRSVVSGRPTDAQEGETAEAILSRIEAAVRDGDLDAAIAESAALSEPVQEAMGGWLNALKARAGAMAAATDYTAGLGANEG